MARPTLLTHWTGKDIQSDPAKLTAADRVKYIERLVGIFESGFWMTIPYEEIACWSKAPHGSFVTYEAPMTCFTELRLSSAGQHSKKYGALGLVVTRQWILDRWGSPVHYVRGHTDEAIVGNLKEAMRWFDTQSGPDAKMAYDNVLLGLAFMKSMSTPRTDDFANIDENEWRIVFLQEQVTLRRIESTGLRLPPHRIPLAPSDLKMVIFPDEQCRDLACADDRVTRWLSGRHIPFVTTDEAAQF